MHNLVVAVICLHLKCSLCAGIYIPTGIEIYDSLSRCIARETAGTNSPNHPFRKEKKEEKKKECLGSFFLAGQYNSR